MRVCEILDNERDAIVAEWASRARALPSERGLPRPALIDHLPTVLSHLATWLRRGAAIDELRLDEDSHEHAVQRVDAAVSLEDVIDEYRLLRTVVEERALAAATIDPRELVRFNAAVDKAIAVIVQQYTTRRDAELREQGTRSRLALAASKLGTWDWRPIERRSVWDARMNAIFEQSAGGALDQESFLRVVHPDDVASFVAAARERLAKEDDFEIDYRVIIGGREKWLRSLGAVVERTAEGRAARVIGTTADVTDAKAAAIRAEISKRELEAIARLGDESLRSPTVDELLPHLLDICKKSCDGVDTATILLRDGDALRVRASIGLDARRDYRIAIGQGFAGTIAATRAPLLLRDAQHSELAIASWVRELGLQALYGVPLLNAGELVGVAHIGSRSLTDFPEEVKHLFVAIADRAASAIVQRELRDALARRNAELEAIMSAAPDALVVIDEQSIIYANPAYAELLGVPDVSSLRGPLTGLRERIKARDPATGAPIAEHDLPLRRALRGERVLERVLLTKLDTRRDVHAQVAAAPIVANGRIVGAVSLLTDVTPLVELERQRDAFMHAVVHDLRNPLASIVTIAQLVSRKIEQEHSDSWAVDRLRKLESNALRLDRLLKDLLDVALAKGGRLALGKTPVSVADVLREQAVLWSAASTRHTVHASGCAIDVLADRDRLTQVLDNLLSNAIKYSPKGGNVEIACEARPEEGEARITVRDEGLGIPREEQRRIFEPYARGAAPTATAGHGLGLFITSEIVRQHGGEIGVESEPGKGSTFWFTLPLADARARREEPARGR